MSEPQQKFLVAYARINIDRMDGIVLSGVYFGAVCDTTEEAAAAAKKCVNTIRGGTILPRIFILDQEHNVINGLYDAMDKFERVVHNMQESDAIIKGKPS